VHTWQVEVLRDELEGAAIAREKAEKAARLREEQAKLNALDARIEENPVITQAELERQTGIPLSTLKRMAARCGWFYTIKGRKWERRLPVEVVPPDVEVHPDA